MTGAKLPPSKLYNVKLPIGVLAEMQFYAPQEHRLVADFVREAIREKLERCRKQFGRMDDETKTLLTDDIIAGYKHRAGTKRA